VGKLIKYIIHEKIIGIEIQMVFFKLDSLGIMCIRMGIEGG
jgi:hypothetical protein